MFEITLICVGKLKEKFYKDATDEYVKRLKAFCKINVIELPEVRLPESPSQAEIKLGLEKEAAHICENIPKGAWFCIFTPEGQMLTSEALADKLQHIKTTGISSACFLIGSSFGIAESVKKVANYSLSFSPMTFPHHLARIMALEQLYRAESIQHGAKYHK